MPAVEANGITLAYEDSGDPHAKPLVLIMGLVTQLVGWPDPFCGMLVDAGHRVIRFDNRDVGLSSKMDHLGTPDIAAMESALAAGRPWDPPYTLLEMAADVVGLMDALGLDSAHIAGLSMGGMIAQVMGLAHPGRTASLTIMQSTTGEPDLPKPTPVAMEALMSSPPAGREAYLDYMVEIGRAFSGDSPLYDPGVQRSVTHRAMQRSRYLMGFTRQLAAIQSAGGRRTALANLRAPTLVIHGSCDPLARPAHGRDVAAAIPGARLMMIDGLGHGMAYPELWPAMAAAIAEQTAAA
jgi:pimeloyl-ACP methyl ester carboxylesterase